MPLGNKLVHLALFLAVLETSFAVSPAHETLHASDASNALKGTAVLISLSRPVYPPLARQANISGEVSVAMAVHVDGTTEATVESGHPMLKQAALDSATKSRFKCQMCSAPASYVLVYSFKQIEGHNCCSAISAPATVEQEPVSTDQQGRAQTLVTIAAEHMCICDPTLETTKRMRSMKCLYLWKCSLR
jgi:hypothetical protein